MNVKEALVGIAITIVGGVAVFWATSGYLAQRQLEEQRQAQIRQQAEVQRKQAEADRLRHEEQQRKEAARKIQEEKDRAKQPRMSELEMDINRNGSDYKDFAASNVQQCLDFCTKEEQCKAITFRKSSRQCWMKTVVPSRSGDPNYISAVKIGGQ